MQCSHVPYSGDHMLLEAFRWDNPDILHLITGLTCAGIDCDNCAIITCGEDIGKLLAFLNECRGTL